MKKARSKRSSAPSPVIQVMDTTLRDVHRFSFPTLAKMKDEADKLLSLVTAPKKWSNAAMKYWSS